MGITWEEMRTLEREGRYSKLVSDVDTSNDGLARLSAEERALLADAMLHLGRTDEALGLCGRDIASARTPVSVRARYEMVSGLASRRKADLQGALQHLNVSLHLARESGNVLQIAWSAIQQFRLLTELQAPDGLAALVRQVRVDVTKAGDPHATAYMHDAMAMMEAARGNITEARRHQELAASIVERNPNAWLEQIGHIGVSYLDYFDGDYPSAIRRLHLARELSEVAGGGQSAIIDCNEGHALATVGRFDEAVRRLTSVCSSAPLLFTVGALEGLARVYLATERLFECQETLVKIQALCSQYPKAATALGGRWAAVTWTKLLLKGGRPNEVVSLGGQHLRRAIELGDRFVAAALCALIAEAASVTGDEASAVRHYWGAIEFADGLPDLQAACLRAAAAVLRATDPSLASSTFRTATAVWKEQGNVCAPRELPPLLSNSQQAVGKALRRSPESVIRALGTVFSLAHNHVLLARELEGAVHALGCDARLTETSDVRSPLAEVETALDLGEYRGRRLTLTCRIPDNPAKAVLLGDLLRIGRAAVQLERYREDERSRAALWPADPVEAQGGALYLAEEMQTLLATARRIAPTDVPALITGETGTGKEVLARTIHACSPRAGRTFLPFNCTSVPRDMLDAQLFGYRRGAFTGATDHFPGVIRAATGGTLFLDEIGELPLDLQPKLLRFLEAHEIHPIGESRPLTVDVRVMAATNADLQALVAQGRFREDLYYRLDIVQLRLPPLRERRVEIPAFATHYLGKYARDLQKGQLRLAEETVEYLLLYRWPGNVRHLANEMRRLAVLAEHDAVLMPEHLSAEITASRRTVPASERALDPTELVVRLDQPLAAAVEHLERTMVQNALRLAGGRVEEAAARLGLSRKGLYLKRQRFGLLGQAPMVEGPTA